LSTPLEIFLFLRISNEVNRPKQENYRRKSVECGKFFHIAALKGDNYPKIMLDKVERIWFNADVMRQINRKNSANWWWPVDSNPAGRR
jgi:hypothetical protein